MRGGILKFLSPMVILCWITSPFLQSLETSTPVKFKLIRGYLIVIQVTAGQRPAHEFLLDTATSTTLVSKEFAIESGIKPIDRMELISSTGSTVVPRSRLPELAIADARVQNLEVLISDLKEIRAIYPGIDGVIGQNFLSAFNYLIDYQNRLIEIDLEVTENSRIRGHRIPFEFESDRVLVTAPDNPHIRKPLNLVLDSAVPSLILFKSGANRTFHGLDHSGNLIMQARTDHGNRPVQTGHLSKFFIGREKFFDLPFAVIDSADRSHHRTEDGLLPTIIFESIYINNHEKFLIINPGRTE